METEAHVYALAVSASVLLSFFPFFLVMLSLFRHVLHWRVAEDAIYLALNDSFPGALGDFLRRNIPNYRVQVPIYSTFLLLFTANGIFEPLEVALNRAWGVTQNRPYWKNQLVALGLIFICGTLAMLSLMFTALNAEWISHWPEVKAGGFTVWVNLLAFKLAALPISILALFLVYWLLPNRRVEPGRVVLVSIVVGLLLEAMKYLNLLFWPRLELKIRREYFLFEHSVTILLWSFMAALVVLAGAHWTARHESRDPLS